MNVVDCPGVSLSTDRGGCQMFWMEPDTSLQYGVTVRGAAASTLSWKSLQEVLGVGLLQGGVVVALGAGRHVARDVGVDALHLRTHEAGRRLRAASLSSE